MAEKKPSKPRVKRAPAKKQNVPTFSAEDILRAILAGLGGSDHAGEIVPRLFDQSLTPHEALRELASRSEFERLHKLARTSDIMESGRVEADYGYVGLPPEAREMSFQEGFETIIKPRLAHRVESFAVMFEALRSFHAPLILETGCLRVPNNWDGDGQSTFQFDWFARDHQGEVISIDINPDSIESARRACSGATSLILNDSVASLHMLAQRCARPAALIYLDSFDLDRTNPTPSAIHHAMELAAVRPLIGPGTLICVDDFNVEGVGPGGKGLVVDQFMHAIRAEVLYSGYQKIWRFPG
ncbi:ATP-grasp domain-containing protein [Kozakia baliensis]|uniref:hypothetical protein n=1 Tax=Kozakia baliensis TaxID=153496 RepID=UPI000495011E|nr:hypothetical protein [Kozakia baliensis]